MADRAYSARINVQVSGLDDINRLNDVFAKLRAETRARPTTVRAGGRRPGEDQAWAQRLGGQIGSKAGDVIYDTIRTPFASVRATAGLAVRGVTSVVGPLGKLAAASVGSAATLGAAAVAIIAIGIPVFNLAATLRILRTSFRWVQEGSERQLKILARAKRTFPGAVGDALRAGESRVAEKLNIATAIMGEGVEDLGNRINQRFSDVRLGRGLRGDRDIFARWGITPQAVQAFEQARGGERIDVTDYLYLFIRKREELDARLAASTEGTAEWRGIIARRKLLFDDSLKLFNQRFSDAVGTWTEDDWNRLGANLRKATPLGAAAPGADIDQNARDFVIEFATTQDIFAKLKKGIVGDVQPTLVQMMDGLRDWMTEPDQEGRVLGRSLRQLATALSVHAWETMEELIRGVKPEDVEYWIDLIKNEWRPEETIRNLAKAAPAVRLFAKTIAGIIKFLTMKVPIPQGGARLRRWLSLGLGEGRFGGTASVLSQIAAERGGYGGGGGFGGTAGYLGGGGPGGGSAGGGYSGDGYGGRAATGPGGGFAGEGPAGTGSVVPGAGPQRVNYFQRMGARPLEAREVATIQTPYGRVSSHPQAAGDAEGFFAELHAAGAPINRLGSYNKRRQRWSSQWSSHAYAAAWDIDDKQFLSPSMQNWVRQNPEKFRGALDKWNMAQPLPAKDPAHIEWKGPKPVARGEGEATPPPPGGGPPRGVGVGPGITQPEGGRGAISKATLKQHLQGEVAKAGLVGFVPRDAARYGIKTGAAHEWAHMFTELAGVESSYRPGLSNVTAAERRISAGAGSHGLYQLSPADAKNYGLLDRNFTMAELKDPTINTWAAVQIAAARMKKEGTIGGAGMGAYWGPIKRGQFRPSASPGPTGEIPGEQPLTAPPPAPAQVVPAGSVQPSPMDQPQTRGSVVEKQGSVAATRRMPIGAATRRYLDYAAAHSGLQVEVFSGGQAPYGSRGPRTGSTRHDIGGNRPGAADIKLRDPATGRILNMRNPADARRMAEFTAHAVTAGATGVGAGLGYMGAESIHIGGGTPATWGGASWIRPAWEAGRRRAPTPPPAAPTPPPPPVQVATTGELGGVTPAGRTPEQMMENIRQRSASRRKYLAALSRTDPETLKAMGEAATGETEKDKEQEDAKDLIARREERKKSLTEKPIRTRSQIRRAMEEGKAAGESAAKSFKEGIKDTKIPIKSLKEEETNREKKSEEKEKEAA